MRVTLLFLIYYGCAFYSLVDPFFGLLFFITILVFRPENLAWGSPVFGHLHLVTAIVVTIGYFIHRARYQGITNFNEAYQRGNVLLFLALLIWLLIVSMLAESSVELSLNQTLELGKVFVLCVLFAQMVRSQDRIRLYALVSSISLGALSFWGILQGMAGHHRLDKLWSSDSNILAAMLVLTAPFVLAYSLDRTQSVKARLVYFACTVSIILCCVYTGSRGGFLGLSVGVLVMLATVKARVRLIAAVSIMILLAVPLLPETYTDRMASIFAEKHERDASAESRPALWRIALRIWQDYPIAGVGLLNFSDVKENYAGRVRDIVTREDVSQIIFGQVRRPHGLYPCLLVETGLVGTSLFLTLLLRNMLCRLPKEFGKSESQRSLYLQVRGAQAGLIGFSIASFFGDFYNIEMFYLQLMVVGALRGCAASLVDPANLYQLQTVVIPGEQHPGVARQRA